MHVFESDEQNHFLKRIVVVTAPDKMCGQVEKGFKTIINNVKYSINKQNKWTSINTKPKINTFHQWHLFINNIRHS